MTMARGKRDASIRREGGDPLRRGKVKCSVCGKLVKGRGYPVEFSKGKVRCDGCNETVVRTEGKEALGTQRSLGVPVRE